MPAMASVSVEPPPPTCPAPHDPAAQSGTFIHGLIGLSPAGLSEAVRSSISSLARRDPNVTPAVKPDASGGPSSSSTTTTTNNNNNNTTCSPPEPPPAPPPQPRHLLALPPEILLMVLQRLDFADIFRLRKTCKQLHHLASPSQIRTLFGPAELRRQLLGHCKSCLVYDPSGATLLQPRRADPGYPLASRCLDCAVKARDPRVRVGRKICLASYDTVWVCRWCGYPIVNGAAFGCEQMHRFCHKRYNDALFIFFILGWLQLGLGIVAAALAWRYYRHSVLVFAPTVINFILLWICLAFIILRGNRRRTYHWTLALELTILSLWIPPIYYVAAEVARASPSGSPAPKSTQATLALFALNMLFRLINCMGNIVLLSRFDTTERGRSESSSWRRPFHYLATALVMWTYPQSLEQKYPPDYL